MLDVPAPFSAKKVIEKSHSVDPAIVTGPVYGPRLSRAMRYLAVAQSAMPSHPFILTSAMRSAEHNATLPNASPHSHHLTGYAVDFVVAGVPHDVVWRALRPLRAMQGADGASLLPYDELIVYDDHVHLSFDPRNRGKVLDFRAGSRANDAALKRGIAHPAILALLALVGVAALTLIVRR